MIAAYLSGCSAAERELFGTYRELLVVRARRHPLMVMLRRRLEPEDVADETLMRALRSNVIGRLEDRGRGSLRKVLERVLDRVLLDLHRGATTAKRGSHALPVGLDGQVEDSLPASDPTPTSEARAAELVEMCRRELTEREWQAWRLVELEGLESGTAALRIGTTGSAVRGLVLRARAKLIQAMAEQDRSSGSRTS
jgi:RNA polymerase sigma factor (sigma-70 family)